MANYEAYLNRVYFEMIKASLTHIDNEEASIEKVQLIRPESARIKAISELVAHIQRISLLGISGKLRWPLRFGLVIRGGELGHANNAKLRKDLENFVVTVAELFKKTCLCFRQMSKVHTCQVIE